VAENKYLIETKRCLLRKFELEDAEWIYRLNLHPDIYKFTTDPPFQSIDHARDFLDNYRGYLIHGYGRWAVISKENSAPLGWCGLKLNKKTGDVDVGYRFLPEHWGFGYAVETGLSCCLHGFERMNLSKIIAQMHYQNSRSIRVAEKMGMKYEKHFILNTSKWLQYVIRK
jgi:RimJ/RimL family protein N-acetyltransferase